MSTFISNRNKLQEIAKWKNHNESSSVVFVETECVRGWGENLQSFFFFLLCDKHYKKCLLYSRIWWQCHASKASMLTSFVNLSFCFYAAVHTLHGVHCSFVLNIGLLSSCNTASCTCNTSNFVYAHVMCYVFSVMLIVHCPFFLGLNKSFDNVHYTLRMI